MLQMRRHGQTSSSWSLDQQSNSARQTVGCCSRLGKDTILILEGTMPESVQGNLLVDHLLGAEVRFASSRSEQVRMSRQAVSAARAAGRTPCLLNDIPMFDEGSAIAYLESTCEIVEALGSRGLEPDCLYMSSSGKGQAGQVLAQKLLGGFRVRGITATDEFDIPPRGAEIANRAARTLGLGVSVNLSDIENDTEFVGAAYGFPSEAGNEAVRLFTRTEGIILDPIYTGFARLQVVWRCIQNSAFDQPAFSSRIAISREVVARLLELAEATDERECALDIPELFGRRQERLAKIAEAKKEIEARAAAVGAGPPPQGPNQFHRPGLADHAVIQRLRAGLQRPGIGGP